MMARVIACRVIERTSDDLAQAVFAQCTGRIWTPTFRDPFLWLSEDGEAVSLYRKRARKLRPALSGEYYAVSVGAEGGRTTHVHRLMAETWLGPPPFPKAEVRHLDGNRFNNRLSNLAWGSYEDQWQDKLRHGTDNRGERNPQAKLTQEIVRQMRLRRAEGATFKKIADEFGVTPMTAHRAATGRSWK